MLSQTLPAAPDLLQRSSSSNRLLSIAVVIVFALFFWSALYFPRYLNFNPDEARLVISLDHLATGWFDENPLSTGTHFGSQLQYYLLPKITTVTVKRMREVAAVFSILTLVYVIWLSRAYAVLSKAGLLVLLLLMSTTLGINTYGQWGAFDYSERILESVLLLHVLLFLHERQLNLSKPALVLLLSGLCLVTIGYAALVVPIVMLLVVAFVSRRTAKDRDDTTDRANAAVKAGLILLVPVIAVGLVTLKYGAHPEFRHPRPDIQHLFFPLSGRPQTASGLLGFVSAKTGTFLVTTFAPIAGRASATPYRPTSLPGRAFKAAIAVLSLFAVLGFLIGLIRSFFERTRDPTRFVIGAYVGSVLVSLLGLAVLGLYAFGDVRYALFLYVPLLVVSVYGMRDGAAWIAGKLFPSSPAGRLQTVGVAALVGIVLVMSAGAAELKRIEKNRYNAEFTELVKLIETDRSPLVFCDTLADWNLLVLGKHDLPNKRRFLLNVLAPRPFEEFRNFVASGEDVLWITYHEPRDESRYAPYVAQLETTHFKADDRSLFMWRVTRWKNRNSPE